MTNERPSDATSKASGDELADQPKDQLKDLPSKEKAGEDQVRGGGTVTLTYTQPQWTYTKQDDK